MGMLQAIELSCLQRVYAVSILTTAIVGVAIVEGNAQVLPAQDSVGTQVLQQGQMFEVHGGTVGDDAKLLFHSFEKFDLGNGDTAKFHVSSDVETIFSRITNGLPSQIDGLIEVSGASAGLYLMNPAGVLFGSEAVINLDGDFTVLTAERLEFTKGYFDLGEHPNSVQGSILKLHFDPSASSRIVNLGQLRVGNDYALSLLGHTVINQGTLTGGMVTVAAVGNHREASLVGGLQFTQSGPVQSLAPWLTASGTEHATTIEVDENGILQLTGALSDIPSGTALIGGQLNTLGRANQIQVLGDYVATAGATLQVADGGTILIGGDYRGRGHLPTARATLIDALSNFYADGLASPNQAGGQVVIWADGSTQFFGNISAQGYQSGGRVEVSGKQQLHFDGQVNLRSQDAPGTLLLDPQNLEIRPGVDPGDTNDPEVLYEDTLETSIVGNPNVILEADNNITIGPLSDGVLTFPSSVSFLADADNDGQGSFAMASSDQLRSFGQDIEITAANITVGDVNTSAFSTVDNNSNAGAIRLIATQGNIVAGDLNSSARGTLNNNGNGGSVILSASDSLDIQNIQTTTSALNNNGDAGEISLAAVTGTITTDTLSADASGNNNTGSGGGVTLTAGNNVVTQNIRTSAAAVTNNLADAGNVFLESTAASIITGSIASDTSAGSSNVGNGGAIVLGAPQGIITSRRLTTTTVSPDLAETQGGDVNLEANGDIILDSINTSGQGQGGNIDIITQDFFRAVDRILDTDISLLTTENSAIHITYSSSLTTPFTVGNSDVHGTAGSLVTGVDRLDVPQSVFQSLDLSTIKLNNLSQISTADLPVNRILEPNQLTSAVGLGESLSSVSDSRHLDNVLALGSNDSGSSNQDEQDNLINTSEVIWAQIDSVFSTEFAKALNVPIPATPTLRTIQNSLQEIKRTRNITPGLVYVRLRDTYLELVLVSGEGPPVYHPVDVTRAEMQSVVNDFHNTITNPILRPAQYLPAAQQLYDWLVRPMLDDLSMADVGHIGFILDAGLRSLPMAALHDGERFLIEDYSIGLLPSAGLTPIEPAQKVLSHEGIADSADSTLAMGIANFVEQTDLEAVPLELALTVQGTNDNYYLDHEATLEALKEQLEQERFAHVHLATHAVFEAGNLENSYVQLWDQAVSFNQLQALPLDTVEFLILSACATALGDTSAEFGFAGLAVKVGVQTALASLWSISDEGTLGLMAEFYRALESSTTRSAALHQAQLAMLKGHVGISNGTVYGSGKQVIGNLPGLEASGNWDFSHPAYWSGFTIIGNPW